MGSFLLIRRAFSAKLTGPHRISPITGLHLSARIRPSILTESTHVAIAIFKSTIARFGIRPQST
ncbi:hypothetical protein [Burkholderia cepacia]|uniref:hypothetical protein n=1 Tax=Burkholderia cepacia TaxID=292 RepID=UPI0011BDD92F|nr:hypothetical protein [Burkholderia cepacia]MCE4124578.1 hypothetical protein [Burkholderia cepacia]MDN7854441.1 hypothetical protein [Burkholderia cepacia]